MQVGWSVYVDLFSVYKYVVVLILVRNSISEKTQYYALKTLGPFSKLFIITAFVFGISSQFIDIGMTQSIRYGVKAFLVHFW